MPDFAEKTLEILCWLRKAFCTEVSFSAACLCVSVFCCNNDGETEGGRESVKRENDGEV